MSHDAAMIRLSRIQRPDETIETEEVVAMTSEPIPYEFDPLYSPLPTTTTPRRKPPPIPPKPSTLVTRAESLSKITVQLRDRVSTYIDERSTTFSAGNARTEKPIVVSQATMDRVQAVGRGAAAASNASKRVLGFIAQKVEGMGDSAMQSQSLSPQNKQRLGDATRAFSIVADSLEQSVAHVANKASGHVDLVVRTKYGDQAADTSGHAVTAASKAVGVVLNVRGTPGLLVKSVGKGAVRAQLKDGTEVVLPEGKQDNAYLARTDDEKDLIVLDDDVVKVKVDEDEESKGGSDESRESSHSSASRLNTSVTTLSKRDS